MTKLTRLMLSDGTTALADTSKWKGAWLVKREMPKGTPSFHPMPGKIVVEPFTESNVGNLWLPEDRSRVMGTVVAVGGDELEGDDYPVSVGDVVLFSQNSGVKIRVDRVEVLVFRTSEILCTITWSDDGNG